MNLVLLTKGVLKTVMISLFLGLFPFGSQGETETIDISRRICQWMVIGPLAPSEVADVEANLLRSNIEAQSFEIETRSNRKWIFFDDRLYCRNQDDYCDLFTFFRRGDVDQPIVETQEHFAFSMTSIWSPVSQGVVLHCGATDGIKAWLNQKPVLLVDTPSQAERDKWSEEIQLEEGWNQLLLQTSSKRGLWGYYCGLTDKQGAKISGLEYSPHWPSQQDQLQVTTSLLPEAHRGQPYVWLSIRNPGGDFEADNADASAFRLLARGGTPPYQWEAIGLPEGMQLDMEEGEILGKPMSQGTYDILVRVTDSSNPPTEAEKKLPLIVKSRVTEEWFETGNRIGGLRHHGPNLQLSQNPDQPLWFLDHPEEQADLVTRLGFSWVAYTLFSKYSISNGSVMLETSPDHLRYVEIMRSKGLKFGAYVDLNDHRDLANTDQEHMDFKHEAILQIIHLYNPDLWWFDNGHDERYREGRPHHFEFDGLYSLIKASNPSALILQNADVRARDWEVGDLDVLEVHGAYCIPEAYWGQWPPDPPFRNNPKYQPMDTWKYQCVEGKDGGYLDPDEWCRVLVTMLAEPSNINAPRMMDLDWTPYPQMIPLLTEMGKWLESRKHTILAVRPYEIEEGDWGYDVINPASGRVYLHLLRNPRGKNGIETATLFIHPICFRVSKVSVVPEGQALLFHQDGKRMSIDLRGVTQDPVSTILEIIPE